MLLKSHRAVFFFFLNECVCRQQQKKKKRTPILLGGNTETVDLFCRHSGFMNSSLLSPDLHKSKSQDSRLLYLLRTIAVKHVLKCSIVAPRLATMEAQQISNHMKNNARSHASGPVRSHDQMKTTCEQQLVNLGWFISHINITMFLFCLFVLN